MIKKIVKAGLILVVAMLFGCGQSDVNYTELAKPQLSAFSNAMPFLGKYTRQYNILGEAHTMQLSFDEHNGTLKTTGKFLNQNAMFTTLGYDSQAKRWLGVSDAGSLFVIFWDDANPAQPKIYTRFFPLKNASQKTFLKHLEQVLALKRPTKEDNTFKGWNTVYKGQNAPLNNSLPYLGTFTSISPKNHTPKIKTFTFTHDTLSIDGMDIKQLSYHAGDRRWVGQMGNRYALMFFVPKSEPDVFDISFSLYDNHKYLYNAKPDEVRPRYWFTYKRTTTPTTEVKP